MAKGIVEQLRTAATHPIASLTGALFGGWVPLATYTEAHTELDLESFSGARAPAAMMVLAGLTFSAKTVWQWARLAFDDPWKATGFVLLLECVMVFSAVPWLAKSALCYLVAINAIATACVIGSEETLQNEDAEPTELPVPAHLIATHPKKIEGGRPQPPAAAESVYRQARAIVLASGTCSASFLQQELHVGYNKASRIVRQLEREGIVGPAAATGRRPVLAPEASASPSSGSC